MSALRFGGSFLMGAGLFGVANGAGNGLLLFLALVVFSVGLNLWHEGSR